MRCKSVIAAAVALPLLATAAQAGFFGIYGGHSNDTGGIIPWSPQLREFGYRDAAQAHCDGYHRVARITSVHPRYGDYIGFACVYPRWYDPQKAWMLGPPGPRY